MSGEPKRLDGVVLAEPHDQRHAANDVVPIDMPVEEAVAGGGLLQFGQVADRRREGVDKTQRFVPGKGVTGLLCGLRRLGVLDQDEAGNRRHRLERDGKSLVGIRQRR